MGKILVLIIIFCIVPIYCSCGTVEHKYYVHPQTNNFFANKDFNNPKLKNFMIDGIVIIPIIQAATHEEYWIRMGFYSQKPNQVKIINATIFNPETPGVIEKISVDKTYTLDKTDKESLKVLYKNIAMLWKLKNDAIDKLTGNNLVVLQVTVATEEIEKKKKTIEFNIERKTEKYVKWLSQ